MGGVNIPPWLTAIGGTGLDRAVMRFVRQLPQQLVFYAANQENMALAAWHFYVVHSSTTKDFCGELVSRGKRFMMPH